MEFDEQQKHEASNLARDNMREDRETLASIEAAISQRVLENIYQMRQWQQNLLTLIFVLLGAMIPLLYATQQLPRNKVTFFIGLGLLIIDGIFIANHIKKNLEIDARDLPNVFNDLKAHIREHLTIARELFLNPNRENTLKLMSKNDEIAKKGTEKLVAEASKQRAVYTNDIMIGLFVTSIYLLLGGVIKNNWLYWIGLISLIAYFIVNALLSGRQVNKALRLKLDDAKNLAEHVKKTPKAKNRRSRKNN